MTSHVVAALSGLGIGFGLARYSDVRWPVRRTARFVPRRVLSLLPFGLALAFGVSYAAHPWPEFVKQAIFAMLMLTIDRINRRTLVVPNALTHPGIIVGLALSSAVGPGFR